MGTLQNAHTIDQGARIGFELGWGLGSGKFIPSPKEGNIDRKIHTNKSVKSGNLDLKTPHTVKMQKSFS